MLIFSKRLQLNVMNYIFFSENVEFVTKTVQFEFKKCPHFAMRMEYVVCVVFV